MAISTINQNGLNAPLSLTAPNLGTPSAINLTNATALPSAALPTGSILQVVQSTSTTSFQTSSTSFQASGFTATITPKFATSKILVTVVTTNYVQAGDVNTSTIYRGGTNLGGGPSSGFQWNRLRGGTDLQFPMVINYLDSPATTSATTYQTYIKSNAGSAVETNSPSATTATFTLMEIAG